MVKRIYLLPICIGIAVAVAIAVAVVHRQQRQPVDYGPVMPRVGDTALVDLGLTTEKSFANSPSPGVPYTLNSLGGKDVLLRITCVEVQGKTCRFDVFYISGKEPARKAYTVDVNYADPNVDGRVTVTDTAGKRVPIDERLDGLPVPFHYFLTFDRSYLPATQVRPDGSEVSIGRIHRVGPDSWGVVFRGRHGGQKIGCTQHWNSGEWLWSQMNGSGPEEGSDWEALRKTP